MNSACLSGSFATNCSSSCHYPFYGKSSEEKCHCNAIDCDHVIGCQKKNSEIETATGWNLFKEHIGIRVRNEIVKFIKCSKYYYKNVNNTMWTSNLVITKSDVSPT